MNIISSFEKKSSRFLKNHSKFKFKHDISNLRLHTDHSLISSPKFSKQLDAKPLKVSQSKSPPKLAQTFLSNFHKSKLTYSLTKKNIFVLQDGSSVISGKKLPGFTYPIDLFGNSSRSLHIQEMKDFFEHCQDYFRTSHEFRFLFSFDGKILRCLHEINPHDKFVIVGHNSDFIGIVEDNHLSISRPNTRSPCYRPLIENLKENKDIMENINSQFIFSPTKCTNSESSLILPLIRSGSKPKKQELNPKLGAFEKLKVKLGDISTKIDKTFPTIHEQGLKQLKEKYKFAEGEFHNLYAKFKLLVLLSCGVDPEHRMSAGINRRSFIEYYSSTKELTFVLGRIFDSFDADGGGTISWEEFLYAMNIMWYGTYDQQIDLFFRVYDLTGTGSLSFSEIQALCKLQLQTNSSDPFIDDLAYSFASLIFDITKMNYDQEIPAETIKEIVNRNNDKSLIDMFCKFSFLK